MVKTVKKRDGTTEDFVPEKIIVSALKSGASVAVARRIAKDVETGTKDQVATTEIRGMVLDRLGRENKTWEQDWRTFDRAVKRRPE